MADIMTFFFLSYDALDPPGYSCHRLEKNAQGHHGLRPALDVCTEEHRNVAKNFYFTLFYFIYLWCL